MKTKILSLATTAMVFSGVGCAGGVQAPPVCAVGRAEVSNYVVTYTLKDAQPACAAAQHLNSNWTLAAQKYSGASGSGQKDIALRPAFSDYYSYTQLNGAFASFAAESTDAHEKAPTVAYATLDTEFPVAQGNLSYCNVSAFTTGAGGKVAGTTSALYGSASLDDKDVNFAFASTKFLDTAQYPGTQFTAELTYTEGTCTADYSAVAVWPWSTCYVVDNCGLILDTDGHPLFTHKPSSDAKDPCGFTDTDAKGNPNPNAAFGNVGYQDNLCSQEFTSGNPDDTQVHNYTSTGSGLLSSGVNPAYALTCDHASGYCVAAKPFPSLK